MPAFQHCQPGLPDRVMSSRSECPPERTKHGIAQ
jgi:hypothetical protein